MKLIPGIGQPAARAALSCLAIGAAWMALAQTAGPPPSSPPSSAPSSSKPAAKTVVGDGVWHHFGETASAPSATRTAPRTVTPEPGVWRHFGNGNNVAAASPQPAPAGRNLRLSQLAEMEQQMCEMVNRDRADPANVQETSGRAAPLRWNEALAAVARAHSLDMLNHAYFSHTDTQGGSVATRVQAAGLAWRTVGENIAISSSPLRAESAFMNEPRFAQNHRANILNPAFTDVGIGIVQAPDGSIYVTQDFLGGPGQTGAR